MTGNLTAASVCRLWKLCGLRTDTTANSDPQTATAILANCGHLMELQIVRRNFTIPHTAGGHAQRLMNTSTDFTPAGATIAHA